MMNKVKSAHAGLAMLLLLVPTISSEASTAEAYVELAAHNGTPTIFAKVSYDDLGGSIELPMTTPTVAWPAPPNEAVRLLQRYYEVGRKGDVSAFVALFADDGSREKMRSWATSPEKLKGNFLSLEKVRIEHMLYLGDVISVATVHQTVGQAVPLRFDLYCVDGGCSITRKESQKEGVGEISYALRQKKFISNSEPAIKSPYIVTHIGDPGKIGTSVSIGFNVKVFPLGVSLKQAAGLDRKMMEARKAIIEFHTAVSMGSLPVMPFPNHKNSNAPTENFDWIIYEKVPDGALQKVHYGWDSFRTWLRKWSDVKLLGMVVWTGGGAVYVAPENETSAGAKEYGGLQVFPLREIGDGYTVDITHIRQRPLTIAGETLAVKALSQKLNIKYGREHTSEMK